jgi:Spy/CpxP family protein refolding chaperone
MVSRTKKENKKMKNTHKKLIGGLLAICLIATFSAALATGQTDDTTTDTTQDTSTDTPPSQPGGDHHRMKGFGMLQYNLTDEQQIELKDLMTSLRDQNATPDEIRTAILEKLDEFGVLDTQLENEIAQTEQRLTILNREQELRNEGYSWTEITSMIQDEFDLGNTTGLGMGIIGGFGEFRHDHHGDPRDCTPPKTSDE